MGEHKKGDGSFFIGLFIGGFIAAVMIVLWGTDKGKKLAKKMQKDGLRFWDTAEDEVKAQIEKVQEKGEDLVVKGKAMVEEGIRMEQEVVEQVSDLKDDFVVEAAAKADQTLSHIEDLQAHGREATAQLRRRLFKNIPKK